MLHKIKLHIAKGNLPVAVRDKLLAMSLDEFKEHVMIVVPRGNVKLKGLRFSNHYLVAVRIP